MADCENCGRLSMKLAQSVAMAKDCERYRLEVIDLRRVEDAERKRRHEAEGRVGELALEVSKLRSERDLAESRLDSHIQRANILDGACVKALAQRDSLAARCERLQDYYECKMETPQRVSVLEREHKAEVDALAERLREAMDEIRKTAEWLQDQEPGGKLVAERLFVFISVPTSSTLSAPAEKGEGK